jgi:DNA-binding SARP family transcriptional activator
MHVADIQLLGEFQLRLRGAVVHIPLGAQQLLALLGLHGGWARRPFVAGTLWPEKDEVRATANLRSSLWRIGQVSTQLVSCSDGSLRLDPSVSVDLVDMVTGAERLVAGDPGELSKFSPRLFFCDLLPDWYDDWVVIERERLRQLRIHALEALCQRLTALERYPEAINAGLVAVAAEPLRESAHLILMRAYAAEGNWCEVLRAYDRLVQLLWSELGVEPSARVSEFVGRERVAVG